MQENKNLLNVVDEIHDMLKPKNYPPIAKFIVKKNGEVGVLWHDNSGFENINT